MIYNSNLSFLVNKNYIIPQISLHKKNYHLKMDNGQWGGKKPIPSDNNVSSDHTCLPCHYYIAYESLVRNSFKYLDICNTVWTGIMIYMPFKDISKV